MNKRRFYLFLLLTLSLLMSMALAGTQSVFSPTPPSGEPALSTPHSNHLTTTKPKVLKGRPLVE